MTNEELKNCLEDENWELLAPDFTEAIKSYIESIELDANEILTEEQKRIVHNTFYRKIAEVLESK